MASDAADSGVLDQMCDIVAAVFGTDRSAVSRETRREELPAWDSLGHLRLMMEIEARFGLRFNATDIGRPRSVGDLCELVAHSKSGT